MLVFLSEEKERELQQFLHSQQLDIHDEKLQREAMGHCLEGWKGVDLSGLTDIVAFSPGGEGRRARRTSEEGSIKNPLSTLVGLVRASS